MTMMVMKTIWCMQQGDVDDDDDISDDIDNTYNDDYEGRGRGG